MRLVLGLAVIGLAAAAGDAASTREIAIYNDSDFAMVQLQARLPNTAPWPLDVLGKYSLGVGRSTKVSLPSDAVCVYDLLATFDDGRKQQLLAVDTCKPATITFKGP